MRMTIRPCHRCRPSVRRTASGSRGFTLIEMIIVIGVILLLTALTVTVITGMTRRAEIRDTVTTMQLMEQALSEWELASGRQVTFGIDDEPCGQNERYEIDQMFDASFSGWSDEDDARAAGLERTDILWSILSRASSSREIIARINPDYLVELDPNDDPDNELGHLEDRLGYRFLDAWDNPIIAIMPGRRSDAQCSDDDYCSPDMTPIGSPPNLHCPDNDGTIRTPFENRFGIASSRRIFFVSAGPSGRFGNLHLDIERAGLSANQQEEIAFAADNIYSHAIIIEEGRPQK